MNRNYEFHTEYYDENGNHYIPEYGSGDYNKWLISKEWDSVSTIVGQPQIYGILHTIKKRSL